MNKQELISYTAEKTGFSKKDTEETLNAALETIAKALVDNEKVQLVGFGSFEVKDVQPVSAATPRPRKQSRSPHPRHPPSSPARH